MARQSMTTTGNPVPDWVHMADTPPTDEEPLFMHPISPEPYDTCEDLGGLRDGERGTWIGCLLVLLAFATGVGVGMLLR